MDKIAAAIRERMMWPLVLLPLFGIGLLVAGLAMMLFPSEYPSFRLDAMFWTMTPAQAGFSFVVTAAIAIISPLKLGGPLLVGAFIARAAILFTSWLDSRTIVPPPPTRWIWEVLIAVAIMAALGHRVVTVADDR